MDQIDHIASALLDLLRTVGHALFGGVAVLEGWLRQALAPLHLSPAVETLLLLVIGLLILLVVLRLFGGVLRVLLFLVLLLVLAQILVPSLGRPGPAADSATESR